MTEALFVGGPEDGKLRAVWGHGDVFAYAEPHPSYFTPAGALPYDVNIDRVAYQHRSITLFTRVLDIFVDTRMTEWDVEAALARHLFTPTAHTIARPINERNTAYARR